MPWNIYFADNLQTLEYLICLGKKFSSEELFLRLTDTSNDFKMIEIVFRLTRREHAKSTPAETTNELIRLRCCALAMDSALDLARAAAIFVRFAMPTRVCEKAASMFPKNAERGTTKTCV
jgi:hypothetical protein